MPLTLEAQELRHCYGDTVALDGVSLAIAAGSAVALVGESGSGKTTLLRAFNRMIVCKSGRVLVGGAPVDAIAPELLRRRIGYVPQQGGLLPHWTVRQNVALVPRLTGAGDGAAAVNDALVLVSLEPSRFGARYPYELSGGQRQRVALGRAPHLAALHARASAVCAAAARAKSSATYGVAGDSRSAPIVPACSIRPSRITTT